MTDAAQNFGVSAYDLATLDKIPVIKRLMSKSGGLALDIGIGTGYTTHAVFGDRRTACVDLHAPNLAYYRSRVSTGDSSNTLCVVAPASALPFQTGAFRLVLCSEVLEHLEDDDAAVSEIARVLADDGTAVITVPYTGLGFSGFLELCGIKTVHDFPGPERHVRPGYDERSLGELLARHELEVKHQDYYLRLFTKLAVDLVSLAHLVYQRVLHRRRAWTWSDAAEAESGLAFKVFRIVFPVLLAFSRLDRLLHRFGGFGLVVQVRKRRSL
ncbi:MAG TPA: class I SAM-dependent methyltransferase [Blastocatellia bacterium]|nr:class I SAM-dependent methyltransferase [Blastocatellia bacterium]